jgi:hypothetical protein
MIKFFRRIRQNLLTQNKFNTYLLYAIGEIILVVIGILLALQISSWNEQRLENKQEAELLLGLKKEFQDNLSQLNASIKINGKVTQTCLDLTRMIRTDSVRKAPERLYELLMTMLDFNSFDARTGVSGEIVTSGKLNILKNDALRVQLVNWLTLLEDCEEDILFRSENYTINLMPFLMKRFPMANGELTKKLDFDKKNYLETYTEKSPFEMDLSETDLMEFENQIWHHKHNHDYIVINELNVRDFINTTLEMIEEALLKKGIR